MESCIQGKIIQTLHFSFVLGACICKVSWTNILVIDSLNFVSRQLKILPKDMLNIQLAKNGGNIELNFGMNFMTQHWVGVK